MIKRITLVLLIVVFCSFNAFSLVSFFVIEAGLPEDAGDNPHSLQWENALLDVFFEAGHIISNAPILRLLEKPDSDYLLEDVGLTFLNGRISGITHFLIAVLYFNGSSPTPAEVSFYVYNVSSQERVFERQIQGRRYRNSREELDDLKAIARGLVPYFN